MTTFVNGAVRAAMCAALFVALATLSSCGGASGGAGPDGAGQGLVLVGFSHDGIDNVALNEVLKFKFSEPVNPATITSSSIQIRQGPAFGVNVSGVFFVDGAVVRFEPKLAGKCDLSDGGLTGGTQYRIQTVGYPEEFAIKNTKGQPLSQTLTMQFATRAETDPERFIDQVPGQSPGIASSSIPEGSQAVKVEDGNAVVLDITENLEPCSVNVNNVSMHIYEFGDPVLANGVTAPNGNLSGFYSGASTADADGSYFRWGADVSTPLVTPQRIPASVTLVQTVSRTQIVVSPNSGRFPENSLVVVRLSSGITDFGGQLMPPAFLSFTTENLPMQTGAYAMLIQGETPFDDANSTSDVNTARSPGRVQGYLLFAGDGDNGSDQLLPSGPETGATCSVPRQVNSGAKDDFDPATDVVLDTGSTPNDCPNTVDGSTAVVFEFATFRIRSGITVRTKGVNPLIILVQGDVTIESGGRLLVRGDGQGGVPNGRGQNGYVWTSYATAVKAGGVGVAGGGDGGGSRKYNTGNSGFDGHSAFGSADGWDFEGGEGAGEGGVAHTTIYPTSPGTAQGGGGGGHGVAAQDATNVLGNAHTNKGPVGGKGGAAYPSGAGADAMPTPSAGGGGGGGGNEEWGGSYSGIYSTGGGSGGAGGGFVDITSSGNIYIYGSIDAAGGNGGAGGTSAYQAGPGGGGGGAGGGIRLLTSGDIAFGPTTVLTTAGGAGGNSPNGNQGGGGPQNHGTAGGHGRIVLEDSDSTITGFAAGASIVPTEGQDGFYRGVFDATRFQGGGTMPFAQTAVIAAGPLNPDYTIPVQADFVAGIPAITSNGSGAPSIFIEARGYEIKPDGTPDLASVSPWRTVGHFIDSGNANAPTWVPSALPGGVPIPPDNAGGTLDSLDGMEYFQIRFTFYLPTTAGPFDPGPFVDDWTIRFTSDN